MGRSAKKSATTGMPLEVTDGATEVHPAHAVGHHRMSCYYFCLLYYVVF
jgi:hypothetical protein